jgi:hypothetical protein
MFRLRASTGRDPREPCISNSDIRGRASGRSRFRVVSRDEVSSRITILFVQSAYDRMNAASVRGRDSIIVAPLVAPAQFARTERTADVPDECEAISGQTDRHRQTDSSARGRREPRLQRLAKRDGLNPIDFDARVPAIFPLRQTDIGCDEKRQRYPGDRLCRHVLAGGAARKGLDRRVWTARGAPTAWHKQDGSWSLSLHSAGGVSRGPRVRMQSNAKVSASISTIAPHADPDCWVRWRPRRKNSKPKRELYLDDQVVPASVVLEVPPGNKRTADCPRTKGGLSALKRRASFGRTSRRRSSWAGKCRRLHGELVGRAGTGGAPKGP